VIRQESGSVQTLRLTPGEAEYLDERARLVQTPVQTSTRENGK
jgi:hypothetical protein